MTTQAKPTPKPRYRYQGMGLLRDKYRRAKPPALSHPLDQLQPQPATTEAA